MTMQRVGGMIEVQADGEIFNAKGNWTVNLGRPKRDEMLGADRLHGYTEKPQVPFIEGEITDRGDLDLDALVTMRNATVTVTLGTGKVFALKDATFAGEGSLGTEEGAIPVRWIGSAAEEIA